MFRTLQKLAMFSLTRGLIILEESVCQHWEVDCQLMPAPSRAEGLPRQHLPFMVFKYHSGSQANNSTELRRMLNSKSSVRAGSEGEAPDSTKTSQSKTQVHTQISSLKRVLHPQIFLV